MKENGHEESEMRRFLLDKVDEDARSRLEERFVVDSAFRERVLIAEDELVEDYLDGRLDGEEQQRFKQHLARTPEQRRKIRLTEVLQSGVLANESLREPAAVAFTSPARRHEVARPFWRRPLILVPVAAGLLVVLFFGILQGVRSLRLRNQQIEAENRRRALENELTKLNSPELRGRPTPSAISVTLAPATTRGPHQLMKISVPAGIEILELRLALTSVPREEYRAELRQLGSNVSFQIPYLTAEQTSAGMSVVVRLPAVHLDRGDYLLTLTSDSSTELPVEYQFHFGD